MPQPTFPSSLPHRQEEVSSPTSRNRRILLLSPPRTRRSLPSPLLFIQRKTLYSTKVFSFQSPIKYVEQAGTCCIVQVLQRSVNMLALLSKVCCVPTAVLLGSLRSNRVLTGTAAPQPTLPGPAGARPVLQGLLAASRAVWESSTLLHRAVALAVTLRVGDNSQPPTLFFVYKTCYFPFCTSGTVGLLYRHAQSTPCAAREKNRVLLSHAAQGVYQTYI